MNKLAKLKYLPNNFEVIEEGDYVIIGMLMNKKLIILILRPQLKRKNNKVITIFSIYCVSISIVQDFLISFSPKFYSNVLKSPHEIFLN